MEFPGREALPVRIWNVGHCESANRETEEVVLSACYIGIVLFAINGVFDLVIGRSLNDAAKNMPVLAAPVIA